MLILPLLSLPLLLQQYDNFLFDVDGVIRVGSNLIPDSINFIKFLSENGKTIRIVTNNGWKRAEQLADEFQQYGLSFATPDTFVQPMRVAINYFRENNITNPVFYYLGPDVGRAILLDELNATFIDCCEPPQQPQQYDFDRMYRLNQQRPDAVLVDSFVAHTMESLTRLTNYVSDPTIKFFGLSGDPFFRGPHNLTVPDSGSIIALVENIADRKAILMGKPSLEIGNFLRHNMSINSDRTIMFGDSLFTDIKLANMNKYSSCLMLTGVNSLQDAQAEIDKGQYDLVPQYYGNFTLLMEEAQRMNENTTTVN